jgi:hypothetical protein
MLFMRVFGGILFCVSILMIVIPATTTDDNQLSLILSGSFGIAIGITLFGLS